MSMPSECEILLWDTPPVRAYRDSTRLAMERSGRLLLDTSETARSSELIPPSHGARSANRDTDRSLDDDNDDEEEDSSGGGDGGAVAVKRTLLDVLNAITSTGLPSVDLSHVGSPYDNGLPGEQNLSTLGSGFTSQVVKHVTKDDTSDIVPPNTVVALKIFIAAEDTPAANDQVYRTITNEIRTFSHPLLSEHPNIVKLLFVGWQTEKHVPLLALELGAFGSLDYVLRAPGLGPSPLQKKHLTLDIALGLSAVHSAGLIHGDLKPDNILIMAREDTSYPCKIIAKLTDFGGSLRESHRRHGGPMHITPLWCAPEVLHQDADVEWEKSDIYTFGMVAASIWSRPIDFQIETLPSCNFISWLLPKGLEAADMQLILLIVKSLPETNEESISVTLKFQLSGNTPDEVLEMLIRTLRPLYWKRPDLTSIAETLTKTVEPTARCVLQCNRSAEVELSQRRLKPTGYHAFKVWDTEFQDRDMEFKARVVRELEVAVDQFRRQLHLDTKTTDIPIEVSDDVSPHQFLVSLQDLLDKLAPRPKATCSSFRALVNLIEQARLPYHLAECHLMSIGTHYDPEKGLQLLYLAARCGNTLAIVQGTFVLMGTEYEALLPIRAYLCLAALNGSHLALEHLYRKWPHLFKMVSKIICERRPAFIGGGGRGSDPFLREMLQDYMHQVSSSNQILSLQEALDVGAKEKIAEFFSGDLVAEDSQEAIIAALHHISNLPDSEAADLAETAFDRGAKLSVMRPATSILMGGELKGDRSSDSTLFSPLAAAIRRSQKQYARSILAIHIDREIPIPDFMVAMISSFGYFQYEIGQSLLRLLREQPGLCHNTAETRRLANMPLSPLLLVAMPERDHMDIERRSLYGMQHDEAYRNTLLALLAEGADPTEGVHTMCPLYRAAISDDLIALQAYLEHIQDRRPDQFDAHLRDPGNLREQPIEPNKHTIMQLCIYQNALRCFKHLLEHFPRLMEERNDRGLTALHCASYKASETEYVRLLLEHGANVMAVSKDNSSPLARALRNLNLGAADMIAAKCTPEQLKSLFQRHEISGRSMFGRLTDTWLHHREICLIDSFRWIATRGGEHFYDTHRPHDNDQAKIYHLPIWNNLLRRPRPTLRSAQLADARLIEYLVELFPERVNETQCDGRVLLHLATWYGHVEVVRYLLQRGIAVNHETRACQFFSKMHPDHIGQTALDLLALRVSPSASDKSIPEIISRGGVLDIRTWREDIDKIVKLLIDAGGASGSVGGYKAMRTLALDPRNNISFVSMNEPAAHEYDVVFVGDWPEPLPRDESSLSVPDMCKMQMGLDTMRALLGPLTSISSEEREQKAFNKNLIPGFEEVLRRRAKKASYGWRLPPGWEVRWLDGAHKPVYYVDHNTRSTSWVKPPLYRRSNG